MIISGIIIGLFKWIGDNVKAIFTKPKHEELSEYEKMRKKEGLNG